MFKIQDARTKSDELNNLLAIENRNQSPTGPKHLLLFVTKLELKNDYSSLRSLHQRLSPFQFLICTELIRNGVDLKSQNKTLREQLQSTKSEAEQAQTALQTRIQTLQSVSKFHDEDLMSSHSESSKTDQKSPQQPKPSKPLSQEPKPSNKRQKRPRLNCPRPKPSSRKLARLNPLLNLGYSPYVNKSPPLIKPTGLRLV